MFEAQIQSVGKQEECQNVSPRVWSEMTYEERKEVAIPKVTPPGPWPLLSVFTPCLGLTEPCSDPHLCQALHSSLKTFPLPSFGLKSSFHIPFTLPFHLAADVLSLGGLRWAMYWAGPCLAPRKHLTFSGPLHSPCLITV